MADIHPRASKFDASVILFAKSECQPEWRDGCKLASELTGLPEEEAGEKWLSGELEREYWDRVIEEDRSIPRQGDFQFRLSNPMWGKSRVENKNRLEKLEGLKDEILKRIVDALHRGRWLLKGYNDHNEERTAPADLVTFEALKYRWTGSNYIILGTRNKLFCPWLVMTPAAAPQEHGPNPDAVSHEEIATPAPLDLKRLAGIEGILENWGPRWAKVPPNPISARKTGEEVAPRVRERGHDDVTPNYIQKIAEAVKLDPLRRKPGGNYKPSEKEITEAKRLWDELNAMSAAKKLELIK
jgi:hypothetical protein